MVQMFYSNKRLAIGSS